MKIKIIFAAIIIVVIITLLELLTIVKTPNIPIAKQPIFNYELSIEQIFSKDNLSLNLPKEKMVTLIATGDVIPARSVNYKTVTLGNFLWSFEKTKNILNLGDIILINLESPLIDNCPLTNEGMIFCGDKRNIEALIFGRISVANLANNHSANYGKEGLLETVNLLNNSNILTTGINGPAHKSIKNSRFAFLGYNDIPPFPDFISIANEQKIEKEIKEAKKNADIIVVSFHWGDEYTEKPNKRQKELAHLAIDSGADLIIGNHPHWVQPVEIYKNKLIMYAHGNFVFDQMWSERTTLGVIGKYTFYENKLVNVEFFPTKIKDYGQPYLLEGEEKNKELNLLKNNSFNIEKP